LTDEPFKKYVLLYKSFLVIIPYYLLDQGAVYQAIKSDGLTQKLSREDVVSLKAQGATGKVL